MAKKKDWIVTLIATVKKMFGVQIAQKKKREQTHTATLMAKTKLIRLVLPCSKWWRISSSGQAGKGER